MPLEISGTGSLWSRAPRGARIAALAAALLAIVAAIAALLAGGPPLEEDRIRRVILEAAAAAEAREPERLAPLISSQYYRNYGFSREQFLERARRDLARVRDLRIRIRKWEFQRSENEAVVLLRFRFSLVAPEIGPYSNVPVNRLPNTPPGEDERARLSLVREDGEWRIVELDAGIPEWR